MEFNTYREKIFFYIIPIILFSLLPFFLITGPFLSDLSISLIGLLFLSYCFYKKNFSFFKNKFFYFFLFFWVYLLLNSLFNNFNFASLKISFFYFRFGIFFVAITSLISFDNNILKFFFYCLLLCFVSLILDGFYEYLFEENILGWKKNVNRVSSFFGDELILGSYLSRLWPIFFGLIIFFYNLNDNKFLKVVFIFIFILSEVLIFISGERAAFFYLNLSAFFIIIFSTKLMRLRLFTLVISFLLITLISFINPTAKKRMIDLTIQQSNIQNFKNDEVLKKRNEFYVFSKQHTHHYLSSYRMFLDYKLFGVGVKNFRNFCNHDKYKISNLSCSTHPHNTYIQIATETGIVGLFFLLIVLFFFIYFIFLHLFYKLKNKQLFTDFGICILSGILITLWPLAPTGNIFNNWLNIIYYLYIPFLIGIKNFKKNQK